MSPQLK